MLKPRSKRVANHAKRVLALWLALLLLCSGLIGSVAAEDVTPRIPKMAENDGVPMSMEERQAIAAARPRNAAEQIDSDGDGIPDVWEKNGADFNGDGIIDLPLHLMGANPNIPDIFVEVDWMTGKHDEKSWCQIDGGWESMTNQEMFDMTAEEFAKHGINLHIDFGPGSVDYVTKQTWDSYPGAAGGNEIPYYPDTIYDGNNGTAVWSALSTEHLTYLRSPVFHHSIIVDSDDHIGGWGGWGSSPGMRTLVYNASSFMHELGHNLALGHGGRGDSVNYKPNYISTMNYGYTGHSFLFSDYKLPDLDEANLSEVNGIDPASLTVTMGAAGSSFFYRNGSQIHVPAVAGVAVDYNGNGSATDTGVAQDINNDGQLTTLIGREDWGSLQFNSGGAVGATHLLSMYNITYHANGGTGAPESQKKLKGQPLRLRLEEPTHERMHFLGWSTSSSGTVEYAPGAMCNVEAATTLYAVWGPKSGEYALVLDKNLDTATFTGPGRDGTVDGAVVLTAALPVCGGAEKKDFLGWAKNAEATLPDYLPGEELHLADNLTLYGVWAEPVEFAANTAATAMLDFAYPNQVRWVHLGSDWTGTDWMYTLQNGTNMPTQVLTVVGDATSGLNGGTTANYPRTGNLYQSNYPNYSIGAGNDIWLKVTASTTNTALLSPVAFAVAGSTQKTISYFANGGSNAPASALKTDDVPFTLSGEVPTREGYLFMGWGTSATTTSVSYQPGDVYTGNSSLGLFAVWAPFAPGAQRLLIDLQGGTLSGASNALVTDSNGEVTLPTVVPGYPSRKNFIGYADTPDAATYQYVPGETLTLTEGKTIYALWRDAPEIGLDEAVTVDFYFPGQTIWIRMGTGFEGDFTGRVLSSHAANIEVRRYRDNAVSYWPASTDNPKGLNISAITASQDLWFRLDSYETSLETRWQTTFLMYDSSVSRYMISYFGNGGTNVPAPQVFSSSGTKNLSTLVPSRDGYTFKGWNTSASATEASYQPGASMSVYRSTISLYAIWEADTTIAPMITSADRMTVISGTAGSFQVTATGTQPITYSLIGAPAGVSIDSSSGLIRVTAEVPADTYPFIVQASNGTLPDATQNFTLTVANKERPNVSWPTGLTAIYGQTLGDVPLPGNGTSTPAGTFTWTAGNAILVGNAGAQTHNMTFTPDDSARYSAVTQDVTVQVAPATITTVDITVAAPVTAVAPSTIAAGTGNFTIGPVTWSPLDRLFQGNTQYTAQVTLHANSNHSFTGLTTAAMNGKAATIASNTGSTVTLSYQFTATSTASLTGIQIVTQPTKLQYTVGESLDLSGLSVKLLYNDGTDETVSYTDFVSKGIATTPISGTEIAMQLDGTTISISHGDFSASTSALTVGQAAGAAVDAPTMASKTANSVTLYAVAAPATGQAVEYAYNTSNIAPTTGWQEELTFPGLHEDTQYYFFARAKANMDYAAGVASTGTAIRTEKTQYTLTVDNGTGGGQYDAGQAVNIKANPAPAGQAFDCWTTSGGGSFADAASAETTFTMPSSAVTVTATYKVLDVTMRFDANEGAFAEGEDGIRTGKPASGYAAPVPARAGYVFKGWATTADATQPNVTPGTFPDESTTYYAVWEEIKEDAGIYYTVIAKAKYLKITAANGRSIEFNTARLETKEINGTIQWDFTDYLEADERYTVQYRASTTGKWVKAADLNS